jgi:hypothetical protein
MHKQKKLVIARETVRHLSGATLRVVVGATSDLIRDIPPREATASNIGGNDCSGGEVSLPLICSGDIL